MALTLTYNVTGLKVKDEVNAEGVTLQNAVVQTYWKVTGEDAEGNTAEWSGATPFSAANVPAGSFTAFETLTEADVIGWIQNVVDSDASYKAHIEEQLQKNIDQNTMSDATMPWATEPVTPEVADPSADPAA